MAFGKSLTLAQITPPAGKWIAQGRTFLLEETAKARKEKLAQYAEADRQRKAQIEALAKKGKLPIPKWPSIDHFFLQKADAAAKKAMRVKRKALGRNAVAS